MARVAQKLAGPRERLGARAARSRSRSLRATEKVKWYCQRSAFPLLTPRATSASASLPASSPFPFRARLLSLMKLTRGWNWYPCSKVAVDDAGAVGDVAGQAHLGAAVTAPPR